MAHAERSAIDMNEYNTIQLKANYSAKILLQSETISK